MSEPSFPIHSIADTAHWVAYFRARESERPDALFHDPYAEPLPGARGFQIANTLAEGSKHDWAWVARTYLFDTFLLREICNGVDLVVNLAAVLKMAQTIGKKSVTQETRNNPLTTIYMR